MKFLVFGGGGRIALQFAKLAQGQHKVVGVVRNHKHDDNLAGVGAEPAILDIGNAPQTDVTELLNTTKPDVVIWAAAGGEGSPGQLKAVDHLGAVKVYKACEAAGVERILVVSTIDARDPKQPAPKHYSKGSIATSEMFQKLMPDYLEAKFGAEADLQKTGLKFTCLRPGALHNNPAKGASLGITQMAKDGVTEVNSESELIAKMLPASRELVAEVLLACAEEPRMARLTIDVMDGDKSVNEEVERCARDQIDAWKADSH